MVKKINASFTVTLKDPKCFIGLRLAKGVFGAKKHSSNTFVEKEVQLAHFSPFDGQAPIPRAEETL